MLTAACSGGSTTPGTGGPNNPAQPTVYVQGNSYFGDNDYVEYIAGNMPLIFSAPHGGSLQPTTIPTRTSAACGCLNRLHRSRLDANREIGEAACGNAAAQEAWRDAASTHEKSSSIRAFSQQSPLSFAALLRGSSSLGTLFANAGFPAVPSAQDPAPNASDAYFNGGYSTERHSCKTSGQICGVQIEANFTGVRDTPENRAAFASKLADVYVAFLALFGFF